MVPTPTLPIASQARAQLYHLDLVPQDIPTRFRFERIEYRRNRALTGWSWDRFDDPVLKKKRFPTKVGSGPSDYRISDYDRSYSGSLCRIETPRTEMLEITALASDPEGVKSERMPAVKSQMEYSKSLPPFLITILSLNPATPEAMLKFIKASGTWPMPMLTPPAPRGLPRGNTNFYASCWARLFENRFGVLHRLPFADKYLNTNE